MRGWSCTVSDSCSEIPGDATLSAWAPLSQPVFRALWLASLGSNIGTWMQNVGAAWLMTSLTPSPLYVALVQTATYLPVLLIGLPAGAIADIFDRRKVLLVTQAWMTVAAGLLAFSTWFGFTGPNLLLFLTFVLGAGATVNAPAWQAIMPELVPRPQLASAIALNSMGFNISRAIGPALGGLLISFVNPAAAFTVNAISFVGVVAVVYGWKREAIGPRDKSERVVNAVMAGVRYVRYAPELHGVFLRTFLFVIPASALWSLLPLLAKEDLASGSTGYGIMLGALGTGSVAVAALLPRLRSVLGVERLVGSAIVAFGLANLGLFYFSNFAAIILALLLGGACWITITSSFNTVAQQALPSWVRARGLSVYIFLFQGGMALGSTLWGSVAEHVSTRHSLLAAAVSVAVMVPFTRRWKLESEPEQDVSPSQHWPEPVVVEPFEADRGPVLVTTEYCIRRDRREPFLHAMRQLESIRRRDGAIRWGLFEDPANPGRYLESFLVESWAEHMRQHLRVTMADKALEDAVRHFHNGPNPPAVTHWLADDE
ncbi:MAG: MFS transporter [Bryobacterales bacterium]|nr:MFS transporter [Bryobacterales bacterium]